MIWRNVVASSNNTRVAMGMALIFDWTCGGSCSSSRRVASFSVVKRKGMTVGQLNNGFAIGGCEAVMIRKSQVLDGYTCRL